MCTTKSNECKQTILVVELFFLFYIFQIVDVVISNDSDCFVYGAKTVIRNFGIDMKVN